jgi:hypothetical protein
MRKLYKYSELDQRGKARAAQCYQHGLKENKFFSDDDIPDILVCYELCLDTDEVSAYDVNGELLELTEAEETIFFKD